MQSKSKSTTTARIANSNVISDTSTCSTRQSPSATMTQPTSPSFLSPAPMSTRATASASTTSSSSTTYSTVVGDGKRRHENTNNADIDVNVNAAGGDGFATPSLEKQVLDLSRLSLNDLPSPAPQTPIVARKRKPSCVTPPKILPPQMCREKCLQPYAEQDRIRFCFAAREDVCDRSFGHVASDDDASNDSTGSSRKRLRCTQSYDAFALPAPMLPNSPEMEAFDGNPFRRHRPQYSPVKRSTVVDLKFLETWKLQLRESAPTQLPAAPSLSLSMSKSATTATSFPQHDIPGQPLPELRELCDEDAFEMPSRKVLKMRRHDNNGLHTFPPRSL